MTYLIVGFCEIWPILFNKLLHRKEEMAISREGDNWELVKKMEGHICPGLID